MALTPPSSEGTENKICPHCGIEHKLAGQIMEKLWPTQEPQTIDQALTDIANRIKAIRENRAGFSDLPSTPAKEDIRRFLEIHNRYASTEQSERVLNWLKGLAG